MTILYSHQDRLADQRGGHRARTASATWPLFAARLQRCASLTGLALKAIHRAIITAKLRRLRYELMFRAGRHDECPSPPDVTSERLGRGPTTFPQRPMILDDKWDF